MKTVIGNLTIRVGLSHRTLSLFQPMYPMSFTDFSLLVPSLVPENEDECLYTFQQLLDFCSAQPELNFYTTEQLVVLRKELGTFLDDHSPNVITQVCDDCNRSSICWNKHYEWMVVTREGNTVSTENMMMQVGGFATITGSTVFILRQSRFS